MHELDPTWEEDRVQRALATERTLLAQVLGRGDGRTVLDCSCGGGTQAIPLAELGWRVTGTDVSAAALSGAQHRAERSGVSVDWHVVDMRELGSLFTREFDWVVSCMALDNILSDDGLRQAAQAMYDVLKPGGRCYLRLRDFDHLLTVRPRYEFKEERIVPNGRAIRLEDWLFDGEHLVDAWVFLHEDSRKTGYQWQTTVFAYRRRALRKVELEALLRTAGFQDVRFLPQDSPWDPYQVVADSSRRW
jgi:SAM-dependent methyltransferase